MTIFFDDQVATHPVGRATSHILSTESIPVSFYNARPCDACETSW